MTEKRSYLNRPPKISLFLAISFSIIYILVFGERGLLVQRGLELKINKLTELSRSLERKHEKLRNKYELLQDEDQALEIEGKKYMLLSDNSRILRFVENEAEETAAVYGKNPHGRNHPATGSSPGKPDTEAADGGGIWRGIFVILALLLVAMTYFFSNSDFRQFLSEISGRFRPGNAVKITASRAEEPRRKSRPHAAADILE